jgi:hypothetical protein
VFDSPWLSTKHWVAFHERNGEDRPIAAVCYAAALRENPNHGTGKAASHTVKETAQITK